MCFRIKNLYSLTTKTRQARFERHNSRGKAMQFRSLLLSAAALAVPSLAHAQDFIHPSPPLSGLYIGAGVGPNWLQNEHLVGRSGEAINGSISSNVGMAGVASIGWAFSIRTAPRTRKAICGITRSTALTTWHFPPWRGAGSANTASWSMLWYDVSPWLPNSYVAPYIGVGVGYSWARLSGFHLNGVPDGFPAFTTGSSPGAIAYQFILGTAFDIPYVGAGADNRVSLLWCRITHLRHDRRADPHQRGGAYACEVG